MDRLQKVIAAAGVTSRRGAEDLIRSGRVTVNGARAELGQKVDAAADIIEVDGSRLPPPPRHVYYLVNKPAGIVSTSRDTHGRPTVIDLVPAEPRVVPVGRLDADSVGLLILTNDGDLTLRLTHPRYEVPKTYRAVVESSATDDDVNRLVDGVLLDDGPARAVGARIVARSVDTAEVEIVMAEGRKREVRRMFDAIGHPVRRLERVQIGPVTDGALPPGEWRFLTDDEVAALYAAGADV